MTEAERPPSVDRLARSIATSQLPPAVRVRLAREAIAEGKADSFDEIVRRFESSMLRPTVNATGVLLHTNLGRAPFEFATGRTPTNLELSLRDGTRSDRQGAVSSLAATLCDAEAALVVNNGASAVLLALTVLAAGRKVLVSRGESVSIGGGFRIPEVLQASGALQVDVGTTNRTTIEDFQPDGGDPASDVACILRVHPSNFSVTGFVTSPSIADVAAIGVPVLADIGSGLLDERCPWLPAGRPQWLRDEPAARQVLAAGAAAVTFSGDKLLGGPQAGFVVGRRDIVEACAAHPLYRAVRPGGLTLEALQSVLLRYLDGTAGELPFWRQATEDVAELSARATAITARIPARILARIEDTWATAGGGTAPLARIPSVAVVVPGDLSKHLRRHDPPVIATVRKDRTFCDLRSVDPSADETICAALASLP